MSEKKPRTLQELRESGWISRTVKQEIRENFLRMLSRGEDLYPGIIGYDSTVIPEVNLALLSGHDPDGCPRGCGACWRWTAPPTRCWYIF